MINKADLVEYFKSGCKQKHNLNIGVEHEKFLFENKSNKRINFETVTKIFNFLEQFNWKPYKEKNNIIALYKILLHITEIHTINKTKKSDSYH